MVSSFDICIRGAGIVGRTLALHLAAHRLRVALVASEAGDTRIAASPDVRAYALNHQSRALLDGVRCWPDGHDATPVLHMAVTSDDGAQVHFDAHALGVEALNWIVDVPVLEQQLAQAVQFQPLITTVQTPQPAALTVVCEGRFSRTRDDLHVDMDLVRYRHHAIAARVHAETPHMQVARQWFHQDGIVALLPLGGARGQGYALVWSTSAERASDLALASEDDFCDALASVTHPTVGTLRLSGARARWPLQHGVARHWSGVFRADRGQGAWVLAGDAAHQVHPLAGQGLNLGLGDVAELVRQLTHRDYWRPVNDMRLLRRYERARKTEFAWIGGSGDALQLLFSHPGAPVQAARSWGMRGFDRTAPLKSWVARQAMGQ
ncbi:MAG: FAD-dependent monooxygenase [Rhodoferax sp.]|nr:FAD-dependent monooxygenase [Rhodoferax sp.]